MYFKNVLKDGFIGPLKNPPSKNRPFIKLLIDSPDSNYLPKLVFKLDKTVKYASITDHKPACLFAEVGPIAIAKGSLQFQGCNLARVICIYSPKPGYNAGVN